MKFVDIINPVKWWHFIIGMGLKSRIESLQDPHSIEQLMFRRGQCPQCVIAKKCIGLGDCGGCGCDTWGKMLLSEAIDDCGRWGKMKNEEEWAKYKKEFGIKFYYKFNNEIKEIP